MSNYLENMEGKPSSEAQDRPAHETAVNVIELKNVSKIYPGIAPSRFWQRVSKLTRWAGTFDFIEDRAQGKPDVHVLDGVDLVVPNKEEGEFLVIAGPSGSGKSTLLRFMSNLVQPTSGEVYINGLNVLDWRIQLGMVFQDYSSFPWLTVLDNVALGLKYQGVSKKERRERAMEMIKRVGLQGHELKYAKKPALSGGQLQRVAIARSLLANPKVLLLDEPFGALDVKTRAQMQDLLCSLFEEYKPTIILVTHDVSEAVYLSDDIYILSKPPAKFVHHIKVDLGTHRDRKTKRTQQFIDLVNKVDDIMMAMEV